MLLDIVKDTKVPGRIVLAGELDVACVDDLREAILPELSGRMKDLTLDVTSLTFMDSSGLHLLIETANRHKGDLVLVNPSASIRRVLEVSGIDRMPHLRITPRPSGNGQ